MGGYLQTVFPWNSTLLEKNVRWPVRTDHQHTWSSKKKIYTGKKQIVFQTEKSFDCCACIFMSTKERRKWTWRWWTCPSSIPDEKGWPSRTSHLILALGLSSFFTCQFSVIGGRHTHTARDTLAADTSCPSSIFFFSFPFFIFHKWPNPTISRPYFDVDLIHNCLRETLKALLRVNTNSALKLAPLNVTTQLSFYGKKFSFLRVHQQPRKRNRDIIYIFFFVCVLVVNRKSRKREVDAKLSEWWRQSIAIVYKRERKYTMISPFFPSASTQTPAVPSWKTFFPCQL